LWTIKSGAKLGEAKTFHGEWEQITQLLFTADSRWLVSATTGSTISLWDLMAAEPIAKKFSLRDKPGRLVSMAVSDDGRWLAAASTRQNSKDNCVRTWDLHGQEIVAKPICLPTDEGEICALAMSCGGESIAVGDTDGMTRLWRIGDAATSVSATTLRSLSGPVQTVRFSPDGKWLVVAAGAEGDHKTSLVGWNVAVDGAAGEPVDLAAMSGSIRHFIFTVDGRFLVTAGEDAALQIWDANAIGTTEPQTLSTGRIGRIQSLATSADGHWLAATGSDNSVNLWNIGSEGPVGPPVTIHSSGSQASCVAIAANGNWIATGNDQGAIQLWNLKVDELIHMANSKLLP
jgi:WD40 repeat protein